MFHFWHDAVGRRLQLRNVAAENVLYITAVQLPAGSCMRVYATASRTKKICWILHIGSAVCCNYPITAYWSTKAAECGSNHYHREG